MYIRGGWKWWSLIGERDRSKRVQLLNWHCRVWDRSKKVGRHE